MHIGLFLAKLAAFNAHTGMQLSFHVIHFSEIYLPIENPNNLVVSNLNVFQM